MTREAFCAGLVTLRLVENVTVPPCFIIQNPAPQLSRAVERVLEQVVKAL